MLFNKWKVVRWHGDSVLLILCIDFEDFPTFVPCWWCSKLRQQILQASELFSIWPICVLLAVNNWKTWNISRKIPFWKHFFICCSFFFAFYLDSTAFSCILLLFSTHLERHIEPLFDLDSKVFVSLVFFGESSGFLHKMQPQDLVDPSSLPLAQFQFLVGLRGHFGSESWAGNGLQRA